MENVVSLGTVCAAIHQVQQFLEPYFSLANTHGAEFLSDDHWDKYVSKTTQTKILQLTHEDLVNLPFLPLQESGNDKELPPLHCSMDNYSVYQKGSDELNSTSSDAAVKDLGSFIYQAQKCHLENLDVLTHLEAVLPHCPSESSTVISEDMSLKKLHEVGIMVDIVSALFRSTQSDLVVDFGSGKGYFASELSLKGEIPVIGFDSKDSNTLGASLRDRKLAKKWKGLERENHAVSKEEIHFPLSNCGKKLKLYLGRNARNLASQSLPRLQASGKLQGGDFLWRALLDILLKELNIPVPEKIIGMRGLSKRCKTFQDYVAAAFEKLGISELMPGLHVLNDLEARHKTAHAKMSAFFQLKLVLAPVIESLILLDRLAFLLEQ
ncbi:chromosome 12 open reading frame 26, partial [Plakobranchus ocellatus]